MMNSGSVIYGFKSSGIHANGYTLVNITSLGNLDDRRDSYEGTLIYHWKLKRESNRGKKEELNN